ncbi:9866_t:CDS:2, partial [Funneliformis mosseae]
LVSEFRKNSKGKYEELVLSQIFTDAIWKAMQSHISLYRLALEELTKASKDWTENFRAFADISNLEKLIKPEKLQGILKDVIQNGHVNLKAIDNATLASLLKIGIFNENGLHLSFSCSVAEQFYCRKYIKTFVYPNFITSNGSIRDNTIS